jgi:hypothetical protein
MIKNGLEYQVTHIQKARLEGVLERLRTHPETMEDIDPRIQQAQMDGLASLIETLEEEITVYKQSVNNQDKIFHLNNLAQIPATLLKARIVAGLTKEQLAEKAGLKVEQIERFEGISYAKANLRQLLAVSTALGIKVNFDLQFPERVKEAS